jgi:hypothetical protein
VQGEPSLLGVPDMLLGDVYFEMFTVRLFTTWEKPTEFGWECQQDWPRIMVRIDYYLKGCMEGEFLKITSTGRSPCEGSRTTDSLRLGPLALDTQEFQSHRIER